MEMPVAVTDAQVKRLMEEKTKRGKIGLAAMRSGMHRETARKYLRAGKLPSEMKEMTGNGRRTRKDVFEEDWPEIAARLKDAPELEAKALFEDLLTRKPGVYQPGQVRTFQRRVLEWRAKEGPDQEVFFAQQHRPGEAMQTDFTCCNGLEITICGKAFRHMLCHAVLPYSNWEWATVCHSESMASIRRGVQAALFRLGRNPEWHQTDNSTAATHELKQEHKKRGFNEEYKRLMDHYGMKPRTIEIGKSNQNGDVEALNGALKRRLKQHLLLRSSRDFESVEVYERWVQEKLEKANDLRREKVAEELAAMKDLAVEKLIEYLEETVQVTSWSTIRVRNNTYSVPSRLVRQEVRVRIYEDRLDVFFGGKHQLTVKRLLGEGGCRINYRHIIWSLVQKPFAFARYKYREELFPSLVFRRAYDVLIELNERDADLEYLRILYLAATTMESEVETALELLLSEKQLSEAEQVKALVISVKAEVSELDAPTIDLSDYDKLCAEMRDELRDENSSHSSTLEVAS
jgi:transposase InsO family protein